MAFKNTISQYGSGSKLFHWLIFFFVLFNLIFGLCLADIPKDYQITAYGLHKQIGLIVLGIMILRIAWAFLSIKPTFIAPLWQLWAERVVHFLLYIFLILMPLSGWIGSVAAGHPPKLLGISFQLPIQQNKEVQTQAFTFHKIFAYTLIFLISIHVLAALYHHFIKKDNILRRMLPW